jgi:hypothetical protein
MSAVTKFDTHREIELRRGLYGTPPRSEVEIVRDIHQATAGLAAKAEGWLSFLPRAGAVESARNSVAGVQRLLTELAMQQQGGPPDAG